MSFYDYYDTYIQKQYEKDVLNNGYIKIPFQNKKSIVQPNLILPSNEKYKIKNIYIYKKSLGLDIIDYDGELIIEHIPITNGGKNIFVCILLKTKYGIDEETDIDMLIHKSFSDNFYLNLNKHLNILNPSCLVNNDNTVYIFKNPLLVSSRFSEFADIDNNIIPKINKKDLYSQRFEMGHPEGVSLQMDGGSQPSEDSNVPLELFKGLNNQLLSPLSSNTNQQDAIEGFTEEEVDNNMFIDCQPVDWDDSNTVSMVPVNSDNLINPSTVIFMSTVQNFFIFIILIGILLAVIPNIYKFVIMKFIDDAYHTEPDKNKYLFGFDCLIMAVLFITFFIILEEGVRKNNKIQTSIGILLFVCTTISLILMIVLKIMKKDYYNFIEDITSANKGSTMGKLLEILIDIVKRFIIYITVVFSDFYNIIFLLSLEFLNLMISNVAFHYDITDSKKNGNYYFFSTVFIIFLSVFIIYTFGSDL